MYASAVATVALLAGSATAFVAPSGFNGAQLTRTAAASSTMSMSADAMLGAVSLLWGTDDETAPSAVREGAGASSSLRQQCCDLTRSQSLLSAIVN
eukprot:13612-Heterococcus_DN1.PRE.4